MKKILWLFILGVATSCVTKKNSEAEGNSETIEHVTEVNGNEETISEVHMDPVRPVYHGSETLLTDLIHTKLEEISSGKNLK